MKRPQHDIDAKALEAVYGAARDRLSVTNEMDDDAKSRLIVVSLKSYFAALDEGERVDLSSLAEKVALAFAKSEPERET